MEVALLGLRLVVGLTFAAHGAQKVFGLFGGGGISGTAAAFDQIGLHPTRLQAWVAGMAELAGGLLLAVGLATPFAAAVLIGTMVAAVLTVHLRSGFFNTSNGYEYNLVLAAAAFALAGTGPGTGRSRTRSTSSWPARAGRWPLSAPACSVAWAPCRSAASRRSAPLVTRSRNRRGPRDADP